MSGCRLNNSKKHKAGVLLMAILMAALTCGGCSNGNTDGQGQNGSGVKGPVEIKYLVENPITEVPAEEQTDTSYYRSITITGLKDAEVEKKINERLTESYEQARSGEQPPYRGIKTLIPEGSQLIWDNVSMNIYGSFNNVLSVMLNRYASYAVPDASGTIVEISPGGYRDVQSFSTMDCLNFDLNTGEEIRLEQVFTDNSDYPGLLNRIIDEKLLQAQASEEGYFDMNLYNLKQVKPFTGVVSDQAFFLSDYGLSLIFDYRTAEFETNMQAVSLTIPWAEFQGDAAITKRFYDESKDLYTSGEPIVKTLLAGTEKIDRQEQFYEKIGKVNVYTSASYSSSYPENVREKVLELYAMDEKEIQRLNTAMAEFTPEMIEQSGEAYYELRVSAYSAGHFVSVTKEVYDALPSSSSPDTNGMRQWREYHCYDKNSGKEILFNDVFNQGYDPSAVVKKAIVTAIQNDVLSYGEGQKLSSEEKARLLGDDNIDVLYDKIQGVGLYTTGMDLSVPPIEIGNSSYLLMINIPYQDLGSDNLAIY